MAFLQKGLSQNKNPKSPSLSPLEELFGIERSGFCHAKNAHFSDSISSPCCYADCVDKEISLGTTANSKNTGRTEENTSILERNMEHDVSKNEVLTKPEPPPPPPPPPPSTLMNGKSEKNFPKETERPKSPSPRRGNKSPGIEQLEKKLDLLHGMMLQLIQSVSHGDPGQQNSSSAQHCNLTNPSQVKKKNKQLKETAQSVELLDAREKMMQELKMRLQQMGDSRNITSLSSPGNVFLHIF